MAWGDVTTARAVGITAAVGWVARYRDGEPDEPMAAWVPFDDATVEAYVADGTGLIARGDVDTIAEMVHVG